MTPRDTRDEAKLRELACAIIDAIPGLMGMTPDPWPTEPVASCPHSQDVVDGVIALLRAPETQEVIEKLEARIDELKSRLYERGMCSNGAPHYCPNCDNTFTAPETQDGPSRDFLLAENARLKAALKARETQERGWQDLRACLVGLLAIPGVREVAQASVFGSIVYAADEAIAKFPSPPAQTEGRA